VSNALSNVLGVLMDRAEKAVVDIDFFLGKDFFKISRAVVDNKTKARKAMSDLNKGVERPY